MSEFCFETVLSTCRNIELLKKAKEKGYFIRCYYVLTADPMINVWRVKSRVESGGHDVPEEKIIQRYDRALELIKDLVQICDYGRYEVGDDFLSVLFLRNGLLKWWGFWKKERTCIIGVDSGIWIHI